MIAEGGAQLAQRRALREKLPQELTAPSPVPRRESRVPVPAGRVLECDGAGGAGRGVVGRSAATQSAELESEGFPYPTNQVSSARYIRTSAPQVVGSEP